MNKGHLYDLDEMVLRCGEGESKGNIQEAVDAYRAGAYRAAIISTWLGVYFDLASKIRSLALAGDQEADQWIQHFEKMLDKYDPERPNTAAPFLTIESEILNKASRSFGLIGPMELSELKRLRVDRNRCAHPTMRTKSEVFSPTPELVRTHLRAAIEYVLSKPAIRGQLAIERLLNLARDEGFPVFTEQAREVLKNANATTLDPNAVNEFIAGLFADVTNLATDSVARLRRMVAIEAMRDIVPGVFNDCFPRMLDDYINSVNGMQWRMILAIARRKPWILTYLGILNSNKAIAAVSGADVESKTDVKMILDALYLDGLRDSAIRRLGDFEPALLNSYSDQIPVPILLDEAISRLQTSGSWNRSYQLITELIGPHIAKLDKQMINKMLSAYRSNSNVTGSVAAAPLLLKVLKALETDELGSKFWWLSTVTKMEKLSSETVAEIEGEIENSFSPHRVPF